MPVVLVVEDDPAIRRALARALTDAGHVVQTVETALDALRVITTGQPSVVILDLGLPDMDGADALVMIRAVSAVPIIVATARRGEADMVRLLNAGADDYVTKPFSTAQVQARIAAVLRRGAPPPAPSGVLQVGPLRVEAVSRTATLAGQPLRLARKEFDLLHYLAERAGRVVPRGELFVAVWRQPYVNADPTLDAHLSLLRRKLGESAAEPRLLRTVRGVGVMLVGDAA
ncbi:DNA-binding response regulator, OmpR family, contains REC and winged-helix (wHTH) domain [Micromonospora pattaloongensis]|uniref:DNA-binding response regulator, OmpR family, contains REC and winged-helix (WHTH) domain n=1 Tax=Micromonospora pattaloongensis TaxID=405436 RepID=A0A1H3RWA5_9ACTN|nr:response regulator transcription factor [Micromonospora pattaloongensis]SDZ30003.1 DNA-binding response regulator, OmpR family, contains REC and winged-helix (wHTH) domain [Micromonospora pattaloongensis]